MWTEESSPPSSLPSGGVHVLLGRPACDASGGNEGAQGFGKVLEVLGLLGRRSPTQQTAGLHRTMVKVCKSDREGTVAGTHGNGEVAPLPAIRGPPGGAAPPCRRHPQEQDRRKGKEQNPPFTRVGTSTPGQLQWEPGREVKLGTLEELD